MKPTLPLVFLAWVCCVAPVWAGGMADQVSVIDPHVRQAPPVQKLPLLT